MKKKIFSIVFAVALAFALAATLGAAVKQGLVKDDDGEIRYYVDGVPTYAGLVKGDDGYYYYITGSTNTAIKSCSKYITNTNGLLPAGTYEFDENCRMILKQGLIFDDDGEIRYYVDNVPTYAGLVQDDDGNYYYISGSTLTAVKNCKYNVLKTNDLLPAGEYEFGADGKLIRNYSLLDVVAMYYGAFSAPAVIAWYGANTQYFAVLAGLFAVSAAFCIIFGLRRNKKRKGGDS